MPSGLLVDAKEMLKEQVDYRGLLVEMTKRDLLLRYKQTVMGFGWAVFMPLVNTAVFSVIFTRVAPIEVGVPYPVFAYCGLWVWNFFASALKFSINSLTSNATLVTKVYFPREVFPTSAVIVCLVDFAVGSIVLGAMMIYYRIPVGPPILLLPILVLIQVMFTTAVALLLARWNLFYRDVKYLFEVIIVVWMFATSVVYPVALVRGRLGAVLLLNPMTPLIEAYRSILLRAEWPPMLSVVTVAMISAVCLAWSWVAFHRSEFRFAENV